MTTDKGRPASSAVEQTEGFEIAATKDAGIGRVEIAQSGVTPIDVPKPDAGQTVNITVVAGRPLKLAFDAADVKAREVIKDDLVLEFENGGKVVLKEYMTAFGMLGEVRTTIIQPDGKHYAFTELLSPTAGPRKTAEKPAPGTPGDVVIIQKPPAGETQSFRLTDEKPMALNFGFGQVAKSQVDKDGNLVLTFKDGAVLTLEGYGALKDNTSLGVYFAKGDKIALTDLAPGAGPAEDPGAEGGRLFTAFTPGGTLGPLDHLGPLPPLPYDLIPPPGPPGSPPGSPPPPPPPPPPPNGEKPKWFIEGAKCLVEEVDPPFTFGVNNLMLEAGQTRSIDIRVDFLVIEPGHGAASFADFVGGEDFLFLAIQAAAAAETGITVENLGNGAVRVTFAANASTNQLTFDILAVDDGIDEPVEDFRFVIFNEQVTGGAPPGIIVDGPGTSFVDSKIQDLDDYQVTISDGVGQEGDALIFDIALSNPRDFDIQLDLGVAPFATPGTGEATPGVDFEAGGFEYSIDGGLNWLPATGPDGTIVTIPAGVTAIMVRIESFLDSTPEGDESFILTVRNRDELGNCRITNVVDGYGYIFDDEPKDCPPPPCGPPPRDCGPGSKFDWSRTNWPSLHRSGSHLALAALFGLPADQDLGAREGQDAAPVNAHAESDPQSAAIQLAGVSMEGDDGRSSGWNDGGRGGQDTGSDGGATGGWRWSNWGDEEGERRGAWDGQQAGHSHRDDAGAAPGARDWNEAGQHGDRSTALGASQTGTASIGESARIIGTPGDDELVGTVAGETLIGGAGDDVLYGNGGADVLIGGAGDDVLVAKAGFAEILGGGGFDTFRFDDSGVLDLSLLAGKLSSIEQVDMTGTGNVDLKLTFQDLLTMTDGGHQLTILGDSGDRVSADFTGHSVSVADMGSFTRYIIDGGAATLDIDNNVQKNIIGI